MKWTADNDQLLFVKLIETHDVSIKAEKIRYDPLKLVLDREAWPKDGREVPTARAISERILRIKNALKASAGGSVPSTPRKRKGPGSVASTPRTAKARRVAQEDNRSESPTRSVRKSGGAKTGIKEEPEEITFDAHNPDIFYSFDGLGGRTLA